MTRRAAGRVALALMMVLTVVAGPMAGSAAADTGVTTDCGVKDAMYAAVAVLDPEISCGLYDDSQEVGTRLDAYAAAQASAQYRSGYATTRINTEQDLRALLWMKGKTAMIEAMKANATKAETKAAFTSAVRNHSSLIIANDLRQYSAQAVQASYLSEQTGGGYTTEGSNIEAYNQTATVHIELTNGSYMTYQTPTFGSGRTPRYYPMMNLMASAYWSGDPGLGQIHLIERNETTFSYSAVDQDALYATHPNANKSTQVALVNGANLVSRLSSYIEAERQIVANGQGTVDEIYPAVEAGKIDPVDLWDPTTIASQASTDFNSTGYHAFRNSQLSALGLTGDTNVSHVVETQVTSVSYAPGGANSSANYTESTRNATIEGTLFLAGDDTMSLDTGTTYDPATLNGSVYMTVESAAATDTGESLNTSSLISIAEPFTIQSATNTRNGNPVNTTDAEGKNYSGTNVTEFRQVIEELIQERNRLQNQEPPEDTGNQTNQAGGGISWPGGQQVPIFVVATILIAIVLLSVANQSRP